MLDPRAVVAGQWSPGDEGCWDRITALRVALEQQGGLGSPKDTQAQFAARVRQIEEIFIGWARESCNDFCPYVIVDPETGAPIVQERMHCEIQHALDGNSSVAIEAFRGSGKSTQLEPRVVHTLGKDPGTLIKLVAEGADTAIDRVRNIRNMIEAAPRVANVFPELKRMASMPWTDSSITVQRDLVDRNPSLFGAGITSRVVGGRCMILIGDDATPSDSMSSPAVRTSAIRSWTNVWTKMLVQGGRIWFLFTPWHEQDLSSKIRGNDLFTHLRFAVGGPQGCDHCPDRGGQPCDIPFHNPWSPRRWPSKALEIVYRRDGSLSYDLSHRLLPFASSTTLFPPHLFAGPEVMRADLRMRRPARAWLSQGIRITIGMDLALSAGAQADWTVICVVGWDERGNKYLIDLIRRQSTDYRVQLQWLADAAARYQPDLIFIEGVQFQRILTDITRYTTSLPVQAFYPLGRGKGKRVEGAAKKDLLFGVPSLRIELENQKWRFPRGDEYSRDGVDALIAEARMFTLTEEGKLEGVGAHDDCIMAWWIASEAAKKMGAGLVDATLDQELAAARREAQAGAVGLVRAKQELDRTLGIRLEGLEDVGKPRGLLSSAGELGLLVNPGAGTKVVRSVPVQLDPVDYEEGFKALDQVPTSELEALGGLVRVYGRAPTLVELVQGGFSPRGAGILSAALRRWGWAALQPVLVDKLRAVDDESRLLSTRPAPDEDDPEIVPVDGEWDDEF